MKMEILKRTESLTRILLAVAILLGALTVLKLGCFVSSSNALQAAQVEPNKAGPDEVKKVMAQSKARVEEIKKNNLFLPAAARQNPVSDVIGILGQEALIGDKWYKVGDSVGDAKIVAIEPTKVKVVWNGQQKEFAPITSTGPGGRGGSAGPSGRPAGPEGGGRMAAGGARRGGPGPARSGMSADERAKFREQMANASPEERRRMLEEMRQKAGARVP